ncbi:hypothetical protein IHE44_0004959 [Lamprotornis superbus]|uniref:Solute carrier family 37 member 1 n=1 Tax=Lamprotornis superbus TaxID=245042 RepID=A0A835NQJ3_9PASS|nr:hypothetical protein IHE44_0004959 [Lamprotornis superbus]
MRQYRAFIFSLTFLLYASFHLSRKPISIVKGELHKHCASQVELDSFKEYAAQIQPVKKPFNASHGLIGERLPIRYYLTGGMLASGLFTAMFGLGYFYNVHNLWFYIMAQIANGLVQTTGWPSVVTCIGNWFGKGRRGLIMGVWNSHTSVGNILGSLIAAYWVSTCWGLSFVVPGVVVAVMGVVCFLFLIELFLSIFMGHSRNNLNNLHGREPNISTEFVVSSKTFLNGASRCRIQMPTLNAKENGKLQDPEVQHLLTDSENCSVSLSSSTVATGEGRHGTSAISFLGALRIPGVVEFSLCLLFAKLVSYTFLFWLPLYITNVGGILAGLISDRLEKRASTCGMMLLLAAPTLYMFSAVSKMGLEATVVMLLISGALVNGPYALITTAVSADLGTHKSLKGNARALSTVTAIIDGTGSVGSKSTELRDQSWDKECANAWSSSLKTKHLILYLESQCASEDSKAESGEQMMVMEFQVARSEVMQLKDNLPPVEKQPQAVQHFAGIPAAGLVLLEGVTSSLQTRRLQG